MELRKAAVPAQEAATRGWKRPKQLNVRNVAHYLPMIHRFNNAACLFVCGKNYTRGCVHVCMCVTCGTANAEK